MKKILILLIAIPLLWSSCDTIDGSYLENPDALTSDVIIFEFTGMNCPNCPMGHKKIDQLNELYGHKIHPIAIHCGVFAVPDIDLPVDYRTKAGDDIYEELLPENFPSGVVNNMVYDSIVSPTTWASKVASNGSKLPFVIINVETSIDDSKISIHLEVHPIEKLTGNYKLCAYLTEDGVIGKQLDGSELITDYVHNHMLRAAFGDTWGKTIQLSEDIDFDTELDIKTEWNRNNLHVVPFILNESNFEILPADIIFVD
jgi:thiol-disulfide isomerase/thioredoxin